MKALKRVVLLLVLAVIGVGGWFGYKGLSKPKIFPVKQVALSRESMQSTLSAIGTLASRDELALAAPVSSTVLTIPVDTGAKVSKGQVLATFDETDFADRLAGAQATEREAAAEFNASRRNLRTLRPIVAAGGEPEQSLREARTRLTQARARLARARAQASAMQVEQRNFNLTAPVDGVITRLDARAGQFVTRGKPVLSLVPTDNLAIRARIDQSVSTALSPGTSIDVSSESQPGESITLQIDRIDPSLEREGSTSYVVAWINYDPASALKLRLNQQVDLSVVTESTDNAIALPLEGLITRGDEEFVRIIDNGRLKLLPVKTGIQDGALIEVREGLTGDETIVIPVGKDIREGAQVRLIAASSRPGRLQ